MKKTGKAQKIILCVLIVLLMGVFLTALSRPAGIANKEEDVLPPLFDTPSYVELYDGDELAVDLQAKKDLVLGSFSVVLVNTAAEGKGKIEFDLYDASGDEIWSVVMNESDVKVGEWTKLMNPQTQVKEGECYRMVISPKDCNIYFIKTFPEATNRVLPFTENVEGKDCGISLGVSLVSDRDLTYGDVFYHAGLIGVMISAVAVFMIVFGPGRCRSAVERALDSSAFRAVLNDLFLVALFITICFSIYINGYLERINISADSAGYLREAVNMAAGNGFNYDAIAGYRGAWFANWPILYPFMITCVMKLTGLEVYMASKVLSMILVGILILILRIVYKKDAWFFALTMTNMGLMYLYWYSWSELPFIIFMLLFAISLGKVVERDENKVTDYVMVGVFAFLCFLTRYFGMFTYFVVGAYLIVLIIEKAMAKRDVPVKKLISLAVSAAVSGCLCLLYLINNKLQNGMPSGVSRSAWWDDYKSLTNDLIKALLAEVFNFFRLEVPAHITEMTFEMKALLLILLFVVLLVCVCRNISLCSRDGVLIVTAAIYYGMFIVIRYFSSMDTFYFRFFAPATFLFTLGMFGILIGHLRDSRGGTFLLVSALAFVCIIGYSHLSDHILKQKFPYYETIQMGWDEEYSQIPERSVVIFSTLDYRSQYYRADVVEGTIDPADTLDTLKERYYGSRNMCILMEDARVMMESGIYDDSINAAFKERINDRDKYMVINLE